MQSDFSVFLMLAYRIANVESMERISDGCCNRDLVVINKYELQKLIDDLLIRLESRGGQGNEGSGSLARRTRICKHGNMAMKEAERQRYEARARVAQSLAHPSRLFLLDLLSGQEMSVKELTGHLELDQSTVSKHLNVLRNVGLVSVRKEGAMSLYSLHCDCLDGFFSCLEQILQADTACRLGALEKDCS